MLTIRALRPDDLPALIEMERAAPAAAHWRESEYEMLLASNATPLRKTVVAEKDGQPIGFAVSKVVVTNWEIENIVVSAGSQRQGVGRLLLSHLIEQARSEGAQQILLEVRSGNTAAKNLYTKCGFSVVGGRRAYYHDPGDDAVLYTLDLKGSKEKTI